MLELSSGNVLLTWESFEIKDGSVGEVYAKIIDESGNTVKSVFRINDYKDGLQWNKQMLLLSNGNMLLNWISEGQDGDGIGVYGKVIDESGNTVKSEFRVNEYTNSDQSDQQMLELSNGNVLLTWES